MSHLNSRLDTAERADHMRKLNELENRVSELENNQSSLAVSVASLVLLAAIAAPIAIVYGLYKLVHWISLTVRSRKAKKALKAACEAEEASHDF